jgi:CRP-like cAMP-binding protein
MRYPTHHLLLDQLPPEAITHLLPILQRVTLEAGHILHQTGQPVSAVYFPVTAQIDEVLPLASGPDQLLRQIDARAMAGCCVVGDPIASRTARVRHAGDAYRMAYGDFVLALDAVPAFREAVLQDAARACLVATTAGATSVP